MVQLNARASISIFQLIFFTPALAAAIFLCTKHGFGRSSGWLFLLTVSIFRIAGGATQLATYSNPSEGLFTASAILGAFGLSTLLLASLGLLSRTADSINLKRNDTINPVIFRIIQLLTLVGLILSIVGDSDINFNEQTDYLTIPVETKVGICILVGAWILICLVAALVIQNIAYVSQSERPLPWAVLVCLPLILIRLIYPILGVFLNDSNFSLLFPSTAVEWTLSTIEECTVVLIYLLVGFKVPKLVLETQGPVSPSSSELQPNVNVQANTMPAYAAQPSAYNEPRGVRWRGSIILTLVGMVSDLFTNRDRGGEQQNKQQAPPTKPQPASMA